MNLYEIIKSLQEAQGSNAKQAILMQHKDNALLKEYMRVTYDPAINFWIKKVPNYVGQGDLQEFNIGHIESMLGHLAERDLTGKQAERWLGQLSAAGNAECKELIKLMIDRSIGAGVGDTMVLKTWPDLYFSVPYQRCSLLDKKAKEKFSKEESFLVQTKADAAFGYLVSRLDGSMDVITRAGNKYPKEFAAKLCKGLEKGKVVVGEVEVFENINDKLILLDRKTGNGILNSLLKSGEIEDKYVVKCVAWDMLTEEEFAQGKSNRPYYQRLEEFKISGYESMCENISLIPTWEVKSLEEAFDIYAQHTSQGLEGCIIKTKNFLWKDGTSKDCVKMKVEFEIDLKITGVVEGSGKAAGMCGALQLTSSCGKLVTDVGTGMTDDMRKVFWMHKHDMIGKIVTIKANDIISKRGSDTFSCFLPVFVEERLDKTEANSYDECVAILSAAKGITTG